MARKLNWLHGKTFYQALTSLLVLGRASFTGGKVFRSTSQSALCTTAVGSVSLCSRFDSVEMAGTLTFLHGETGFPGVDEPYGP